MTPPDKDEILRYIGLCISYKHNNDISPFITESACEKENLLFENAIEFLEKLDKENAELKDKLNNLASVAEVRLANWQKYEKENAELKAQIEKMKVCQNCDNWNWKHNKCEKKLKGDCFKHSKWVMRNF